MEKLSKELTVLRVKAHGDKEEELVQTKVNRLLMQESYYLKGRK